MTKINVCVELITPAKAEKWLKNTEEACAADIPLDGKGETFKQRARSPSTIRKYVHTYMRGEWHPDTVEPIKLAIYKGLEVVLDGQHRLAALIEFGRPLNMWVARGVPFSAFSYLDQGAARTMGDILTQKGWKDPALFATIGRLMWREDKGGDPRVNTHKTQVPEAVMAHYLSPKQTTLYALHEKFGYAARKSVADNGPGAHRPGLLYCFIRAYQIDKELALAVAHYLSDPDKYDAPHPVWCDWVKMMRAKVLDLKVVITGQHQAQSNASLCNLILAAFPIAWNVNRAGAKKWGGREGLRKQLENASMKGGQFIAMQ